MHFFGVTKTIDSEVLENYISHLLAVSLLNTKRRVEAQSKNITGTKQPGKCSSPGCFCPEVKWRNTSVTPP